MFKHFLFSIFLILISNVQASNKDKILENLQNTKNLNFDFEQNINGKVEIGNCTIQYPKKIFCKYQKNNKILVSNGKSLVIKTLTSFYRYPLDKTSLNLILDKNFLIQKIENLKEKKLGETFINFEIIEEENEINIFFDNENFDLVGWQTKDIYQNLNVTYLSSIKKNHKVDKDLFKLPAQN
ncbi:outer-membrane lipoprotein carrier protein LolA [Candidatus Pelagibacter sp.]|jgi:outer membrane lipoprotein-sorting protein|nr:outer-membrane lipoprotein carrier protein LolA [Candidatus Pelagibacter sp.]MDB3970262.1 outer-membrane lipoprotein carrier protein LolA [Candidatus Pelagibacter sp.]MDB4811499.1 outer-membrane lipoprotein carrier protein LolA [Candidatus Pelagibacter sp.]MDC0898524.1 outer-membrane lipoprotein carrier protein LolA [Candidatus Pelagibacter sp.]